MKFSVLLSLYHKESPEALIQCFESIWNNQTIKPTEIILVIDGEIGHSLQHCLSKIQVEIGYPLKTIQLPVNLGLGNALNQGLSICTYDWIFRMDTDDICLPDRFEKQIQFITDNPNIALFGGQVLEFNKKIEDAHTLKSVPTTPEAIKQFSLLRCPFNHMTVAYKKKVILDLGGYQHHLYMEDYNLWLRVIGNGFNVANLPDVLLYARVGNGMYSRRKGFQYVQSEKQLLQLKKELHLQHPIKANILFIIRASIRLLPTNILSFIYNKLLRKKFSA